MIIKVITIIHPIIQHVLLGHVQSLQELEHLPVLNPKLREVLECFVKVPGPEAALQNEDGEGSRGGPGDLIDDCDVVVASVIWIGTEVIAVGEGI